MYAENYLGGKPLNSYNKFLIKMPTKRYSKKPAKQVQIAKRRIRFLFSEARESLKKDSRLSAKCVKLARRLAWNKKRRPPNEPRPVLRNGKTWLYRNGWNWIAKKLPVKCWGFPRKRKPDCRSKNHWLLSCIRSKGTRPSHPVRDWGLWRC